MEEQYSILLSTGVTVYFQRDDVADVFNCFTLDDEGEQDSLLFSIDSDLGITNDSRILSEKEELEFANKFHDFINVLCIYNDKTDTFTITRRNQEDEIKLRVDYNDREGSPYNFELNGASTSYSNMQDMLSDVRDTLYTQGIILTVEQKADLLDYLFDMV